MVMETPRPTLDVQAIRELFPITRNYNFQNTAAVAPLSVPVVEAAQQYLSRARDVGYVGGGFYQHAQEVRRACAGLINAHPDEVTFVKSTSEGLSFVANGLSWNTGDKILTTTAEFPANRFPWLNLQARGVRVQTIIEEDGRIPLERMIEAMDARTRLVAVSAVQYASGFRMDLAALGQLCQERGVLLCVDAIQALGVHPIDVRAMNIDFLSADGHKWLCGPEGLGIFYCRRELLGYLRPTTIGWNAMKHAEDVDNQVFEFREDARRFDGGAYNLCGIYALGAAVELIQRIGVEQIQDHVMKLTDRLVAGVRERGYRVVSSRQRGEGSAIVAFISDVHDVNQLQRHLQGEHRVVLAVRKGRLRSSPHFFNTAEEIDQVIHLLPRH